MQKQLKIVMLLALVTLSLNGCSTVTPDPVKDTEASFDASSPKQYSNQTSGFLGFIENERGETIGGLFSKNAIAKYNNLIADYRVQFRNEMKVALHENDGVKPHKDVYGNDIFLMDAQHVQYFMKLGRWAKQQRSPDTMMQKLKDKF